MAGLQDTPSSVRRRDRFSAEFDGDGTRELLQPGRTGIVPHRFLPRSGLFGFRPPIHHPPAPAVIAHRIPPTTAVARHLDDGRLHRRNIRQPQRRTSPCGQHRRPRSRPGRRTAPAPPTAAAASTAGTGRRPWQTPFRATRGDRRKSVAAVAVRCAEGRVRQAPPRHGRCRRRNRRGPPDPAGLHRSVGDASRKLSTSAMCTHSSRWGSDAA